MQKWLNVGLAIGVAAALVIGVIALLEVSTEYQVMSASGYLFALTDGTGTVKFSVSDAGAVNTVGAADFDSTLNVDGNATFNAALDVDGNVSSGTGAFTVTDGLLIDGQANVVQLTVQGYTTQTNPPITLEQSDGTDVLTMTNSGAVYAAASVHAGTFVDVGSWLNLSPVTAISLTADGIITPTGTYQPLTSATAVTCSTSLCIADGSRGGDLLILVNQNASDVITIDGTGGNVECKADIAMGSGDIVTLVWDAVLDNWYCVSSRDNS